jgi:hypothetical protein
MQNKVQGDYPLEVKFVDEKRVYLNFWDSIYGNDVCCQIKYGKIFKFVHSPAQVEADEVKDEPEIEDVFEQKEISLTEFLELVQTSILEGSSNDG